MIRKAIIVVLTPIKHSVCWSERPIQVIDPGGDVDHDGNCFATDRGEREHRRLCDEPSECTEVCGDGLIVGGEGCDPPTDRLVFDFRYKYGNSATDRKKT